MNKIDLVKALGASTQEVDSILKAMRLKTKDADYQDGLVDKMKPILALMTEKQIDAKTAVSQLNGAIAKAEPAESTAIATAEQVKLDPNLWPKDSVENLEEVIDENASAVMQDIPDIVSDRTNDLNSQVRETINQITDRVYAERFSAATKDPGLAQKVREAIERKKSQQSSDKSG